MAVVIQYRARILAQLIRERKQDRKKDYKPGIPIQDTALLSLTRVKCAAAISALAISTLTISTSARDSDTNAVFTFKYR